MSKHIPEDDSLNPAKSSEPSGTLEASWDSTSLASFDLTDAPASQMPQQQLVGGRFLIESQLPSGGMSILYLAHDIPHDRKVVLKHLNARFSAKESYIEKELQALQKFAHRGVIKVWEVRRLRISGEDAPLCLVMEYAEGPTLKACLPEQQVHLSNHMGWVQEVMTHLLDAVAHIHAKGVIHRDLKPENIIVTASDQVKLIDFGLAADVVEVRSRERGCGTYFYTAPEVLGGKESTPRSDVYSLGMILYELLTGMRTTGNLTRPSDWWKEEEKGERPFPKALDDVIMCACAAQPAKRYANGEEMAEAFHLAFSQGPWETRQSKVPVLSQSRAYANEAKPRRRYRAAWIGLIGMVAMFGILLQQMEPATTPSPARSIPRGGVGQKNTKVPPKRPLNRRLVSRPAPALPKGTCKAHWLRLGQFSSGEKLLLAQSQLWEMGVKTRAVAAASLRKTRFDGQWLVMGPWKDKKAAETARGKVRTKLKGKSFSWFRLELRVVAQTLWAHPWPKCGLD